MRLQSQIKGSFRRFKPQQTSSNDGTALRLLCVRDDVFQIFNRSVNKHTLLLNARHRWHERIRPRRHNEFVVGDVDALERLNCLSRTVDSNGTIPDVKFDSCGFVPFSASQHQLLGVSVCEEIRQPNSVVCRACFFTERHNPKAFSFIESDQLFAES